MKLGATLARTETRLVIADALQKRLDALRERQAACDAQRAAVVAELLQLAAELGDGGAHERGGATARARAPAAAPAAAAAAAVVPDSPATRGARTPVSTVTFRDVSHVPAESRGDTLTVHADEPIVTHICTAWKVCGALRCRLGCITLGAEGEQAVLVAHERGQSWTSAVPPLALAAVQARVGASTEERAASEQRVAYAAFGTDDRYYVRWESGLHDWIADEACSAQIKARPVATVTFGAEWASHLILFKDGAVTYAQVPPACARALRERASPADARLRDAALGPAGEWWLAYADGTCAWGGVGAQLDAALRAHDTAGGEVTCVRFGVGGTWVLRASERSDAVRALLRAAP
ncbi:hypothetical protein KFE25_013963 [Diacronema lutheri]|uniref:Uncharacterized protein n=1 Tax=Diacronema lutheri TaxID=2081491 RepID=A0A8J5XK45_DIALT|nr:hypothetical protein KFE25_013963 [Diacronema lutheri]